LPTAGAGQYTIHKLKRLLEIIYTHLTVFCNFFDRKMLLNQSRWVDTETNRSFFSIYEKVP